MNHFSSIASRFFEKFCVLVALSVLSISAVAQNSAEEEEAVAGAMGAMDAFMLGFNARDPEAWAASLNYPHVRFASGTVTFWDSAEEFAQTLAFESLPASGWDHSHWLTRDVGFGFIGRRFILPRFFSDSIVATRCLPLMNRYT